MRKTLFILIYLFSTFACFGRTIIVDDDSPVEFNSIQAAIDDTNDGDTIEVLPGTYTENINFNGKRITVRAISDGYQFSDLGEFTDSWLLDANDPSFAERFNFIHDDIINFKDFAILATYWYTPSAVVIDGNGTDVVVFNSGEDANSVIEGITITGGRYGVYSASSSAPAITKCTITDNQSHGIYCYGGTVSVFGCRIIGNGGRGVDCGVSTQLTNCVIARNSSTGVYADAAYIEIINCTLFGNNTGVWSNFTPDIRNCIIWNNGNDISFNNAQATTTYCCIEDEDYGQGNIFVNPMFVDSDSNDFHLLSGSRCIDLGDPCSSYSNEPNGGGGRINMGAYGNTSEATTATDQDNDDIPDGWETYYWPGDDPNQHDPNDDPDGDGFSNLVEYLFGYDPNQSTAASMKLWPCLYEAQIDPTEGETVTITYLLNMSADVNVSFTNTDDSSDTVRTITQSSVSAGENQAVWNGKDDNSKLATRYYYDITIGADDGDGNSTSWTSPDRGATGPSMQLQYQTDTNNFDPYSNIPTEIVCTLSDYGRRTIDIVKDGYDWWHFNGNDDDRIYHLVEDRLLSTGDNTFYWYGRWGADVNDPNAGADRQICLEAFDIWFSTPASVNKGAILVYYGEPFSNLRCNPYRVIPTYDEISKLTYDLAYDANVTIDVYDPDGSYFGTLLNNVSQQVGPQEVIWYGRDGDPNDPNSRCISTEGVYLVELSTSNPNCVFEGSITVYK